jgi:C-terminal processing protease CtpA/Prc
MRGRPARLGALQLGDLVIKDIAGDFFLGDKGAFASPELSGNLGGAVLRRFTVTFDYDAKKMYLQPNADFAKPDDFDRSGAWLFKDGDALKVVAVAPHGPAQKAGLVEGDRIVKIGGEPVSARTLNDWRVRLRELPAGTKLSLTVARSGPGKDGEAQVTLVLADRIPPRARTR